MSRIVRIEIRQVDLVPPVVRTDAIQSFVRQETPMVRIWDADGAVASSRRAQEAFAWTAWSSHRRSSR